MKQPSPIENGFNPVTKEWNSEAGKQNYRKQVTEYAKYITYNQKRIDLIHGTATVSDNCPQSTIDTLNQIAIKAFNKK